jgi:N-acetylmuramoyl-L-alanine amidase
LSSVLITIDFQPFMNAPYPRNYGTRTLVLIDAGHGGLNAVGEYTTPPTTGKRFDHKDKSLCFHGIAQNSVFYEGVSNRIFARQFARELQALNIPCLPIFDDVADTALSARTNLANALHTAYNRNTLLVSLHSNASSKGAARGWEIYTSAGQTRSDALAAHIQSATLPLMQTQSIQNRGTREANFHMLTASAMPAVLIETLFFDNLQDALLLNNTTLISEFCKAYAQGVARFLASN